MPVKKECSTCEFYMSSSDGMVCAGNDEFYGKYVAPDFICDNWEISFSEFCDNGGKFN